LDLLLLDIVLEKENGIQLAKRLREEGNDIPIIFITNSKDFALAGYSAEPVGYLLKPVDRASFTETLQRAYKKYKKNIMVIDTPSQTISFLLDEVLYIEIYDKTLSVHMLDGSVLKSMTHLSSLLDKLPTEKFVQCHRSYVVSLLAVTSICRYSIELKNHEVIPVSKKRYNNVKNAILTYLGT